MNIFHISFSHKIEVQTAQYRIDRPVHFSKSHWYSLFLSFPFCADIFSPPPPYSIKVQNILTPQWISLCTRPRLGTLRNLSCACSMHQKDTFQGNTEAEDDGGRFLWNAGVQLQVYTVSQSHRPQVVYLAFCEPQNVLHTYMCWIRLSQIALHSHHTEISPYFTVKGKKKVRFSWVGVHLKRK